MRYQEITSSLANLLTEEFTLHPSEPDFTVQEVNEVRKTFKSGKAAGEDLILPEILMCGGKGMIQNLCEIANSIKNSISVPNDFNELSITTIHKKGMKKQIKNEQGIFLAVIFSKLIEKLIKNRIDPTLESVNKLQAGSRKGRGCADNIYLLHGLIDHSKYLGKTLR